MKTKKLKKTSLPTTFHSFALGNTTHSFLQKRFEEWAQGGRGLLGLELPYTAGDRNKYLFRVAVPDPSKSGWVLLIGEKKQLNSLKRKYIFYNVYTLEVKDFHKEKDKKGYGNKNICWPGSDKKNKLY